MMSAGMTFKIGDIVRTAGDSRPKMVQFRTKSHMTGLPLYNLLWYEEEENGWERQHECMSSPADMELVCSSAAQEVA